MRVRGRAESSAGAPRPSPGVRGQNSWRVNYYTVCKDGVRREANVPRMFVSVPIDRCLKTHSNCVNGSSSGSERRANPCTGDSSVVPISCVSIVPTTVANGSMPVGFRVTGAVEVRICQI